MRAARLFLDDLHRDGGFAHVAAIRCELFGSLGATGRGHGSDKAVILGLCGESPEQVDPAANWMLSVPLRFAVSLIWCCISANRCHITLTG